MRRPLTSRPRREPGSIDDRDYLPVLVPRHDKPLVSLTSGRFGRLRDHLAGLWRAIQDHGTAASPLRPAPEGFAARVAQAACTLCGGWCCRNGADDAFLDEGTLARVVHERPHLDADAVLNLYLEKVPEVGVALSCIFHGKQGCTLDRALRSDVCNAYFCGGLLAFTKQTDTPAAVVVIAGEADRMRRSPVLLP
jgi:hypothetical protein